MTERDKREPSPRLSWEDQVNRYLTEQGIGRKVSGKSDEFCAAERAKALSVWLLGGKTGTEVTLEQIRIYFAAHIRYAELDQRREVKTPEEQLAYDVMNTFLTNEDRASLPPSDIDELEVYKQAVHVDRPFGQRAAIHYFKQAAKYTLQTMRIEREIDRLSQLNGLARVTSDALLSREPQRRFQSYQAAVRLLERAR